MPFKKNQLNNHPFWVSVNFALLFTGLFSVAACKNKPASNATSQANSAELPADFVQFYENFHADSVYQMAHISFPLEGYPQQVDSSVVDAGGFKWTADKWRFQNMVSFSDTLFTRDFAQPMANVVTETIRQKGTPFGLYRRFLKRDDGWYLIFYSDMNVMKEN